MSGRLRLGVVLVPPPGVAAELVGLRRALGAPSLTTQPPHLTLVPPVNVAERDIGAATRLIRAAGDAARPLELVLGPVRSFPPSADGTVVVHLAVSGGDLGRLHDLRTAVFRPPFHREVDHEFVPHLTLHEAADPARAAAAESVLTGARWEVVVADLVVLVRVSHGWAPWCSAPLGSPVIRGRGGMATTLRRALVPGPEATRLGLGDPARPAPVAPGPVPVITDDRLIVEATADGDGGPSDSRVVAAAVATVDPTWDVTTVVAPEAAGLGVVELVRREAARGFDRP